MYIALQTERLKLRSIGVQDANFILDLVNSIGWLKFIGDRKIADKNDAEQYIQRILDKEKYYYTVFELKDVQNAIGIVTFLHREEEAFPDIGFAILPEFEGNGYTFEACKAYLNQVKGSKTYENIIAFTIPSNEKSIGLLIKLGLYHIGDHKKAEKTLSYFSLKNENSINNKSENQ